MSIFLNSKLTNIINNKHVRNIASKMCDQKAFLPVIMLESTVISGRTYQAYKRGGKTEARERAIDESLTSIVWLGIISWLNTGLSKIIKQPGIFDKKGLPEIEVDLGSDAIRNPLKEAIQKRPEIKNKICSLKFMKIITAAAAGIYLSGIVLPKFYQNLTRKILHKEKEKNNKANLENTQNNIASHKIKMEDFMNRNSGKSVSFGNLTNFIHLMENNAIYKLLTVDVGLFAGRGYSARNKDEMVELLFRDFTSSFFYLFSTPLIYKALSKYVDKYKGKNNAVDATTAEFINRKLLKNTTNMSVENFKKTVLGHDKLLGLQIAHQINTETISIDNFKRLIALHVKDTNKAESIINNAETMLKIRPKSASKSLLTISEVINSVQGGMINDAKFINRVVAIASKGLSRNPEKFISYKEIDNIKANVTKYIESIVEYAQDNNCKKITKDILTRMRNRNFLAKTGYTIVGMAISALFLSTLIPKLQYKITEWRTGKNDFPGIRDIK